MELNLLNVFHDEAHYVKAFQAFAALSSKFDTLARWVDEVFSKAVASTITSTSSEHEELRVLGVGSGSGEMDCMMLATLLQHYPRINSRVVEPSQQLILQYKALAQSKSTELHGVNFDWRQETFQQYKYARDSTKFHFISAVHSMYHVDDVDRSLMYLYNCLEPGGVMLVIIISDDCGLRRFYDRFLFLQSPMLLFVSSADVKRCLDHHKIPYKLYKQPSRLNITKCFDDASEDGKLVVDFLTRIFKFTDTAPEDLRRQVMDYLASSDCSEKIGNEIFLNDSWDAIVINKSLK